MIGLADEMGGVKWQYVYMQTNGFTLVKIVALLAKYILRVQRTNKQIETIFENISN